MHAADTDHGHPLIHHIPAGLGLRADVVCIHDRSTAGDVVVPGAVPLEDEAHPVVVDLEVAALALGGDAAEQGGFITDLAGTNLVGAQLLRKVERRGGGIFAGEKKQGNKHGFPSNRRLGLGSRLIRADVLVLHWLAVDPPAGCHSSRARFRRRSLERSTLLGIRSS